MTLNIFVFWQNFGYKLITKNNLCCQLFANVMFTICALNINQYF